jgi:hypothetical protein
LSGTGGAICTAAGSGARRSDPGRADAAGRAAAFIVFFATTAFDFSPFLFESLRIAVLVALEAFFAGALFFAAESFDLTGEEARDAPFLLAEGFFRVVLATIEPWLLSDLGNLRPLPGQVSKRSEKMVNYTRTPLFPSIARG